MLSQMMEEYRVTSFDRAYLLDRDNNIIRSTDPSMEGFNVFEKVKNQEVAHQFLDESRKNLEHEAIISDKFARAIVIGSLLLLLVSDKPLMRIASAMVVALIADYFNIIDMGII